MVFSGLPFLFFYLMAVVLIYRLTPLKLRNLFLLLASLAFYGWGEPVYILIMLLSILVDYTHGMLVERWRDRAAQQVHLTTPHMAALGKIKADCVVGTQIVSGTAEE